ncbi:FtsB family cell division protein [Clostridium cylindrosporum]|nr:septum formation initiator family protein [Clostridium cylindrosporum]
MKNNYPKSSGYVYGNVAYDYEKQKKVVKERKPTESLKPKKKKSKNKAKIKIKVMLTVFVIFAMAFITVGRYTTILTLSSEIRSEKMEVEKVQKENQNINVDLAKLNNLKAIEDVAISKYGMVKPTKENTYFVSVNPLSKNVTKENKKESALTTMQRILGLIY